MRTSFPATGPAKRLRSLRDRSAANVRQRRGRVDEAPEIGVALDEDELEPPDLVLLGHPGRRDISADRLEAREDGGHASLRVELELEAVRVVGAEADGIRELADRPEAQEHDRRRDDPEAVLACADRHADRGDDPQRGSGRESLDVDAVLDDRSRAEEADAGDHVRDDAGGIEDDADVVPELELRPGEVAGDDEQRGADAHEHVRPEAGLLVAELALEADGARQHDHEKETRDSFPEREIGAHARISRPAA